MDAPAAEAALGGLGRVVALGVVPRLLSFALNQLVLSRRSSPDLFGQVVKLDLLVATSLFLMRECFRVSLTRRFASGRDAGTAPVAELPAVVRTAALSLPITGAVFFLFAAIYAPFGSSACPSGAVSWLLLGMYLLAALVEAACVLQYALALFLAAQMPADAPGPPPVEVAATAEAGASLGRAVCLLLTLVAAGGRLANGPDTSADRLLPFAVAQLASAGLLWWAWARANDRALAAVASQPGCGLPGGRSSALLWGLLTGRAGPPGRLGPRLDADLLGDSLAFGQSAAIKYLLSEGDRLVAGWLVPASALGTFGMVYAYGGLILRFVYAPLEEGARQVFGQAAQAGARSPADRWRLSMDLFHSTLRLSLLIGSCVAVFGWMCSRSLTLLVFNRAWSSGAGGPGGRWTPAIGPLCGLGSAGLPGLLAQSPAGWFGLGNGPGSAFAPSALGISLGVYALSILVMGVNGIVEAFVTSTAPRPVLRSHLKASTFVSLLYMGTAAAGLVLVPGARAPWLRAWLARVPPDAVYVVLLVAANGVAMALRVAAGWWCIARCRPPGAGHGPTWRACVPRWSTLVGLAAAGWLLARAEQAAYGPYLAGAFTVRPALLHLGAAGAIGLSLLAVIAGGEPEFRQFLSRLARRRPTAG
ncbi:hypothetical protein H696_02126 [Fonticula alba]|uniref:Protein RFT1 homolog n=1 Tax=Fonticula alba TaxID=691883 RepID=A0A058ZA43_FONAL|nr:hypothetical protein H696_02126 [Fonticula alba]KCV71174.1 hypothetical protein H696_02126 [Fonticula alba]|eukprot:XP_009494297.1 hypothetical protein H696_02126 [Fonticula alba]